MNSIGNKGAVKLVEKNKEYDYIGFAITPWHAHSLKAALLYLSSACGRKLNGIVIIKPHLESGFMIDEELFEGFNAQCFYYKDDEGLKEKIFSEVLGIKYYFSLKENAGKPFHFLKPSGFRFAILSEFARASSPKKLVAVSIDEGLGVHLYSVKDWYRFSLKEKISMKRKLALYVKYFEMNILNEDKLRRAGCFINAELIINNDNDGTYDSNTQLLKYYRESFEKDNINKSILLNYPKNKYVIINTQPFEEGANCSNTQVIHDIIHNCVDMFVGLGYQVIVKPHPREKNIGIYSDMNCIVCESRLSQEYILAHVSNEPSYIISFFSTTLISCGLIFEVRSISLNSILMSTGVLYESVQETCRLFNKKFGEYVLLPNSFAELKSIIVDENKELLCN